MTDGHYELELTVEDGLNVVSGTIQIQVLNVAPQADIVVSGDLSEAQEISVAVDGTVLDSSIDQQAGFTYQWELINPNQNPNVAGAPIFSSANHFAFTPSNEGTYYAVLTLSDGTDQTRIIKRIDVQNSAPTLAGVSLHVETDEGREPVTPSGNVYTIPTSSVIEANWTLSDVAVDEFSGYIEFSKDGGPASRLPAPVVANEFSLRRFIKSTGNYTITLHYQDDAGASGFDTLQLQVVDQVTVDLPYSQDFDSFSVVNPQGFAFNDAGFWSVNTGEVTVDNSGSQGLGLAALNTTDPLPTTYEMSVEMTANSGPNRWQDGFLIFDYQNENDFKYAGFFAGSDQWTLGHYQGDFSNRTFVDTQPIEADTAYTVHLRIENNTAYLTVDNELCLESSFTGDLHGGQAGLAAYNAVTTFDNFHIGEEVEIGAPINLIYANDFEDGTSDGLAYYGDQRFSVQNILGNQTLFFGGGGNFGLGVAYYDDQEPLPHTFEISAEVTSYFAPGFWTDGFVVFDYQSPTDFKYAGMFVGQNEWIIGHYQGNWGNRLATASQEINSDQTYTVNVRIDGDNVSLSVDTFPLVSATFADGIGNGKVGVAGYNSRTAFDDIEIATSVTAGKPLSLPYAEDFEDRDAPGLYYNNKPYWGFTNGDNKYLRANTSYLTDVDKYLALSYFPLDTSTAPDIIAISARISAKNGESSERNGYITFDYKNDADFKYAGLDANTNQWVIGHYDGSFNTLTMVDWDDTARTIDVNRFYDLEVRLEGTTASISVDGEPITSHDFGTALNQGAIGLAAYHAFTWFDDFSITELVPAAAPLYAPPAESSGTPSSSEAAAAPVTIDTTETDSLGIEMFGQPVNNSYSISVDVLSLASPGNAENGFVIFDYKHKNDFKYAGFFGGHNQWLIGHYQGDWTNRIAQVDWDAVGRSINAGQSHFLEVKITGNDVRMIVDSEEVVSATVDSDIGNGSIGLAAVNARTEFQQLAITPISIEESSIDSLYSNWEDESETLIFD